MNLRAAESRILAGWAHDLGKPLQVIERYAKRIVDQDAPGREARALARAIVSLTDDALVVIDRLMESTRPIETKVARSDRLIRILHRVTAVARGLYPDSKLQIQDPIPQVEIEGLGSLFSVLVNLVENAIHASDGADPVTISARLWRDCLVIDVFDRGSGMSEIVRARAFESYYSTRDHRRATGLGLPEARAQIELLGGRLELESIEGEGTCASVILPIRDDRIPRSAGS